MKRLGEVAEETAKRKVENKVEEKVDKAVDNAFDKTEEGTRKNKKESGSPLLLSRPIPASRQKTLPTGTINLITL